MGARTSKGEAAGALEVSDASEHSARLRASPSSNHALHGRQTHRVIATKVLHAAATVSHRAPAERGSISGKSPLPSHEDENSLVRESVAWEATAHLECLGVLSESFAVVFGLPGVQGRRNGMAPWIRNEGLPINALFFKVVSRVRAALSSRT